MRVSYALIVIHCNFYIKNRSLFNSRMTHWAWHIQSNFTHNFYKNEHIVSNLFQIKTPNIKRLNGNMRIYLC